MPAHRIEVDEADFRAAYDISTSGRDLTRRVLGHPRQNNQVIERLCYKYGLSYPAPHWTSHNSPVDLAPPAQDDDQPAGMTEEQMVAHLKSRGYAFVDHAVCEDREHDVVVPTFAGDGSFAVGIVSDTHGGSRYEQHTFLSAAYDHFERAGIGVVFHAGDITAGSVDMHKGMAYEQHAHGADEQTEYVAAAYPRRDGIRTLFISGNHDHSHLKAGGVNVGKRLAERRDDLDYLGMSGAYVTLNGIRFYLHHPSGGMAYARSYKMQKQIEQFAPESKPKVLVVGHWHVTCVLESYRNVYGMLAGCFEAQTPYLVEKGLYPEIGFSVLDVTYDADGAVCFTKSWYPCYEPLSDDWARL